MERVVNIDINDKHDLYETYNDNYLNKNLLDYLIRYSSSFNKKDQIVIIIDNNATWKRNFESIMKQSLQHERERLKLQYRDMNIKQLIWLITGSLIIMISTFLPPSAMQEILLVLGSVPIWEAVSIELFNSILKESKRVVINGPMGVFEDESFAKGTDEIYKCLKENNIKIIYSKQFSKSFELFVISLRYSPKDLSSKRT